MKHLLKYFIIRILITIPMIFILLTLVFVVLRVMPGDPVSAMLGAHAPEHVIEEKKEKLGLNKPIHIQYVEYIGKLARFDLGESMIYKQDAIQPIKEKLPATIELTFFGMLFVLLIGIPLGTYAASKRRTARDFTIRLYGIIVYCIPVFWMGLMLQLLVVVPKPSWLSWINNIPIYGRAAAGTVGQFENTGFYVIDTIAAGNWQALGDVLMHLLLPSLTLGIVLSGIFVRLTRANMLDVLKSDYIIAARARGIPEKKIVNRHALKNALVPIITMFGLQFALLIAGAILTETTFSFPGMGSLLLERIYARDYPVIQAVIVVFALFVNVVSLIVDILYGLIDPRVRY